jgi:DNA-binding transcriptional LysR family regulator
LATEARLRAFLAVAETGSVRAAAERLVVTESAVSAAVAALIAGVGVPLAERQGRGAAHRGWADLRRVRPDHARPAG